MEACAVFDGSEGRLVGVLHYPDGGTRQRGVVIVVGGPQYRTGSHRQFVLLARSLANNGYPVLRFDYHGMGDSDGDSCSFENVDKDIAAAVNLLCQEQPEVEGVVLLGLCDGASAAVMYAASDPRVVGLSLMNPWVRTEVGEARAYLKHYYVRRLFSRDFWRGAFGGHWRWRESVADLGRLLTRAQGKKAAPEAEPDGQHGKHFTTRMADGWARFGGEMLVILSGNDLTADEFRDWVAASRHRRSWLERPATKVQTLGEANHTFARNDWREEVTRMTLEWLASW